MTLSAARIGNTVAPSVVVKPMRIYHWRASFYVTGAFSLLWVIVWSLTFTEHPKDHPRITPEEPRRLPEPVTRPHDVLWNRLFMRMLPMLFSHDLTASFICLSAGFSLPR